MIGILDDSQEEAREKAVDRAKALELILREEPIPDDLLQRILKYKEEDLKASLNDTE